MEWFIPPLLGSLGALVRILMAGKGVILLPKYEQKGSRYILNLGFLAPALIGACCGWLVPHSIGADGFLSFLSGYSGGHFIEHLIERRRNWLK